MLRGRQGARQPGARPGRQAAVCCAGPGCWRASRAWPRGVGEADMPARCQAACCALCWLSRLCAACCLCCAHPRPLLACFGGLAHAHAHAGWAAACGGGGMRAGACGPSPACTCRVQVLCGSCVRSRGARSSLVQLWPAPALRRVAAGVTLAPCCRDTWVRQEAPAGLWTAWQGAAPSLGVRSRERAGGLRWPARARLGASVAGGGRPRARACFVLCAPLCLGGLVGGAVSVRRWA